MGSRRCIAVGVRGLGLVFYHLRAIGMQAREGKVYEFTFQGLFGPRLGRGQLPL